MVKKMMDGVCGAWKLRAQDCAPFVILLVFANQWGLHLSSLGLINCLH